VHLENIYWTSGIPATTLRPLSAEISHPKARGSNFGIRAMLRLETLQEEIDEKL
jgi:hypothetical protein